MHPNSLKNLRVRSPEELDQMRQKAHRIINNTKHKNPYRTMKISIDHIIAAVGQSKSTVYNDMEKGLFNKDDLASIAYYIVGKTLLLNLQSGENK
jgi:hypothetical protein